VPSKKINTSSTNKRCVTLHAWLMQIPLKLPFPDVSFSIMLNPLPLGGIRRGERVHPRLRSLLDLKKRDVAPLIKTTKDTEVM